MMPDPLVVRVSSLLTCQCATQRNGVVVVVSRSAYTLEKWCCNLAFRLCFRSPWSAYTLEKWCCNGDGRRTFLRLRVLAGGVCVCVLRSRTAKKKNAPKGVMCVLALVQIVAKRFKYS